jgi:hypothetical protein
VRGGFELGKQDVEGKPAASVERYPKNDSRKAAKAQSFSRIKKRIQPFLPLRLRVFARKNLFANAPHGTTIRGRH